MSNIFHLKKKISLETGMYITGIIALIVGIPLIYFYFNEFNNGRLPVCLINKYLGIYCPGCGGSRAVKALLEGRIIDSIIYHPIVLYTVVIYLVFMISRTIHYISRGKIKGIKFHYWFLYGAIVVITANFILKNVLKFCFGIYFF